MKKRKTIVANATNAIKAAKKEAFILSVEKGSSFTNAAAGVDVAPETIWRWRNEDSEFNTAIVAAKKSRIQTVEDVAYANALKSEFDPKYQTSLLAWMNNEGGWSNRSRTEIAGEIDIVELAKIMDKMSREL